MYLKESRMSGNVKTSLTKLFIIPLEWNAFFAVLHKDAAMFALIKCSGWTGTTVNRKYNSKWWTRARAS